MIKNAIAYITRKRNRTLIIFIILTIVLSCLYSCLTIMKSSDEIEKALYESSNSSISITKKDGNYFNVNEFKDIEKIKEIEEKIIQYDGLAKLKDAKVVSGEQRINLRYFQIRLVRKMVYELKLKLYEKLLNMNMYFFNDTHSADAIKTLNWDANSLKDSWFSHIYWVLGKIVIVVSSIITMYFYNPILNLRI